MEPAAVLAVIVKAQGVAATNAQLKTVQGQLMKTDAAGAAMAAGMKRHGTTMAAAGKTMTKTMTVPLLAIGAASVVLSRQYGGAMRLISTQAGASRKEMEHMKRAVLELSGSGKVKQTPKELAEALFHIESVGYRGAKALEVLKASADLATLGQSDMEATTYAMVSALETGIKGTESLQKTMGTMNAIVGAGDLRMEDLTQSLSSGVLISAKQVGLSLEDVGAAMDTFTARGLPANVAATRLRMTFNLMAAPTEKAKKALKGIGLDQEDLAKKMASPGGLVSALELLQDHLGNLTKIEQTTLLSEAFGGARSGTTIMGLLQNLDDVKERLEHIKHTSGDVKKKLKEATSTPGFKLDASLAKLETSLIKLGDQILPVIVPVIENLATAIGAVGTAFAMLPAGTQKWIVMIGLLLLALGPLVTIYGNLVKLGAQFISWIIRSTTATEAAAVANMELAASLEAATVAQTELLIANKSGVVTGSIPIASTAATSSTAAAGKGMAGSMAMGLARFLPGAIALVGIGNIVSSAVQGDSEGALHKAGGAAGGALIGGILGSVVPGIGTITGALVGGGIGSLLGGLIESTKQLHPLQEKLAAQTQRSTDAFQRQRKAADSVVAAQQRIAQTNKAHKESTNRVTVAHRKLNNVVERFGPASRQAHEAELKLAQAQRQDARSANMARRAHELSRNQEKLMLLTSREVVASEKSRIPNLRRMISALAAKSNKDKNNVPLLERLIGKEKELGQAQHRVSQAIRDVASVSPKQAQALRHMTTIQAEAGMKLHGLTLMLPDFSRAQQRMAQVGGGAWMDWRGQLHSQSILAKEDIRSFNKATGTGMDRINKKLGEFAAELGIKGVTFGSHEKGGSGGKKQRGGPITVPGMGTGDTVPLMAHVEPGEVIHVLNTRAVKDRKKLAGLERINNEHPRFQKGGTMGETLGVMHKYKGLTGDTDFRPSMGFALSKMATGTGTHISVTDGYRSVAEQAALYALYLSGKGNLAAVPDPNSPHPSGYAADISPDRGTFGAVAGNYGLGFTVPSEAWHIELLNKVLGATGAFAGVAPKMPASLFTGPDGLLKNIGQGSLDEATKMAQQYLNKNVGAGGVGTVPTGPVQEMAKQMVSNIWGSGQWGAFDALEMSEAGWDYTAVNPSSGAAGLAQALPPSKYPAGAWPPSGLESAKKQLEWMMGYIKDRYGDPSSAWAFHQANNWYQKGGSLGKQIKHAVTGIRKGAHLPKYKAMLKRTKRKIEGIGLSDKRLNHMSDVSKSAERYSEYASNASSLTTSNSVENPTTGEEEEVVTQGLFKGQNEAAWIQQQLTSLLSLRKQVTGAHGSIEKHQLPRVDKLVKDAKNRLRAVQKAIREAEEAKRKIEKKIDEIEQAQKKSKQAVEKEIGELENTLTKAQGAKHPNKEQLESLRGQIKTKKETISGSDKSVQESIKKMNDEVSTITKQNKARGRAEGALKEVVIPTLTTKQTGLRETMKSLYSDGGEVKNFQFMGLQSIQGAGGPTGGIPEPPALGELGGEIFAAQNRLRELGEETSKKSKATPKDVEETESAQVARELAEEWKKKYMVSQAQYATLQAFPSVSQIAAVPFAGSFAKGGVMMAEVGEKGREIVAAPQGSRVIPSHEATSALAESGNTSLVIEELNVFEDGTVEVKANGETFDADVQKVNRKQAKGAAKPSPGIKRRSR